MQLGEGLLVKRLRERLQQNPSSRVFFPFAWELALSGRDGDAIAVLQQGIGYNQDFVAARLALGWLQLRTGQYEAARDALLESVKRVPDNVTARRLLAEAYQGLGKTDEAVRECRAALGLEPGNVEIADALKSLGYSSEATSSTGPAEGNAFPIDVSLFNRAAALISQGRHHEAMEIYDQALVSVPGISEILQKREELKEIMHHVAIDRRRAVERLTLLLEAFRIRFLQTAHSES